MYLHGALCSILFNLICNMATFRKNVLTPGAEDVCKCMNICLQVTAFVIPFNLICNMTVLKK